MAFNFNVRLYFSEYSWCPRFIDHPCLLCGVPVHNACLFSSVVVCLFLISVNCTSTLYLYNIDTNASVL